MKLEKIVLDGFKSFADKTELAFDSQITAIVGPNGCGKSNVVDAVKWVLGEQSTKSLRSDMMADVIFSGSTGRKPLATAEVTIIFSNAAGTIPIDTDQVQISRRIFKTGESEYRINSKLCRLKDIRELFMDTGVGVRAYSIIEQGQVEQLLTASKIDRRTIFEEAAGISKYKAHKKEAQRKLEYTEQNLLRLADILNEVAKQLRSIKLQAGKARNYLTYTQRLKELQLNFSLAEFHRIHTQTADIKKQLADAEQEFAYVAADIAEKDVLFSRLNQQIIDTENQINQADNNLVSVQSKIAQQMQRIEFLSARIKELDERRQTAEHRVIKLSEQRKNLESDLQQYQQDQVQTEKKLAEKTAVSEELEKSITQINSALAAVEADLEDEKSGIIDIVRLTAQLHNELQSISVYRDNLANQKNRLADRAQSSRSELEKHLAEKAQNKARLADIEKIIDQLQQNLNAKRSQIDEITAKTASDGSRLAHSKETRSALTSELAVLKDMEQRFEGLQAGVKSILTKRASQAPDFAYVEGILADLVAADIKYAAAVEAALEGKTDTLIINDTNKLLGDIETIEKLGSRANFLSLEDIEPFVNTIDLSQYNCLEGRLIEFVKYDAKYAPLLWKLLGRIILVQNITTALTLRRQLPPDYNFVTLSGQFLSSDGTIKLGPLGKSTGLISRKSRIRQLEGITSNINNEIEGLDTEISKNNRHLEHLDKLCKDLRTAVYEANTEKTQITAKLALMEQNINRLSKEEPLIAGEIGLLEDQISKSVQKEYDSKQKLQELDEVNSQRSAQIKALESKLEQHKTEYQNLSNNLTELKVSIGQLTEQNKALKQSTASIQHQLEENKVLLQTASTEITGCKDQSEKSTSEILSCEMSVSQLFVEKENSQDNSRHLHDKVQTLLEEQRQTEQLLRQQRALHEQVDKKINEIKVEQGQLAVKEQNLIDKVREQLQIDLVKSYENYSEGQIDWSQVETEMTELRDKIERLGNVNIDAIQQQDDLEKRNEFLSAQVEDLNKSKDQLQQLINKLNRESREKFRTSFEQIRTNFQQIFRKLFGGGKSDILLEDSEDILEAGIEIIAQPPGKETRSISLLSGGEKSLTAIALLFAVFKTKPSPFCFLDEVDAALDEANNERFNLIIREFQKDSQFVVITHSKRTMSIADILYGITMQTRGVSKKISVRFEEYEPENQASAVA